MDRAPAVLSRTTLDTSQGLQRLLAGWLLGYSASNTRAAYARDLTAWVSWCSELDLDPLGVSRSDVDAYARTLEAEGRAPATVARKLSSLASFCGYCEDEGAISRSPVARVRRPRVGTESQALGLDRDEMRRLLDAAEAAGPRDHVLALLLGVNGLRVSEALAINTGDLDTVRGHCTVMVGAKGGRLDRVPLPPVVCGAIRRLIDGRTVGPLLLDNDGARLDRHDAARIVRRLARAAGIAKRIGPHSLRHSAITAALDAGVPLRDVQDYARHRSPVTTRRYDQGRKNLDRHASYAVASFLASNDG